jgi:hypothetical protein
MGDNGWARRASGRILFMSAASAAKGHDQRLFWGCFIAFIATAFGFIIRAMVIGELARGPRSSNCQRPRSGEIFGVGLWPFADQHRAVQPHPGQDRLSHARCTSPSPATCCRLSSPSLPPAIWSLYIGTFICALGNGTVEAVINPVVATVFKPQEKTKVAQHPARGLARRHAARRYPRAEHGRCAGAGSTRSALILIPTIAYGA